MELKDGYKHSGVGLIPRDWSCEPLAHFLNFISYGFTNPMPTVADGVYMITAADIDQGRIQLTSARKTSITSFQKLLTAKSKPRANDVLLTKDGSLGRLALVGEEVICINQSVAVLRPNEKVEPNFLKLLLESPWYQTRMLEDAGGSTIKHIYISIVDKMPIGLPLEKAEQRAIATALSDVDALIAGLERLIAKKRDIKQAAMQQLLTGQTRLPGFSGEWQVNRLGDLADLNRQSVVPANQPDQSFMHFSLPAFDSGRSASFELGATIGSNKFCVPSNAVLLSKLNPRIPRVWAPDDVPSNSCASTEWLVLTPRPGIERKFLYVLCSSPHFSQQMELAATGTTGSHQRISPGTALDIRAPIPLDETEQTAIATVLSDMDADLAALESRLAKIRAIKQGMMQELLTGRTRLV